MPSEIVREVAKRGQGPETREDQGPQRNEEEGPDRNRDQGPETSAGQDGFVDGERWALLSVNGPQVEGRYFASLDVLYFVVI